MSKKFNPSKYDPAADSSPKTGGYRQTKGDTEPGFEGVILVTTSGKGVRLCQCGCGGSNDSIAAEKSDFLQGHDARLKGILIRAFVTGTEVNILDGGMARSTDAMTLAKPRSWDRFLTNAKVRHESKGSGRANKGPVGEKRLVKVGRWEHEGVVIGVKGDKLEVSYESGKGAKRTTKTVWVDA